MVLNIETKQSGGCLFELGITGNMPYLICVSLLLVAIQCE